MTRSLAGTVRALLCAAFVVFFLVLGVRYAADPAPPFGYYLDLGVNIFATATIDAAVRSPGDVLDAVGWAPWDNAPSFAFNPMTTYALSVPLAKLAGHDAFAAVKLLQLAQFALAWLAAGALYARVRGRLTTWAVLAGAAYAIAPNTALAIRGNLDFGFAVALVPGALVLALAAIDRLGSRALPLAGVLCGIVSLGFVVEYVFFTSIPMYAICVVRARPARAAVPWAAFAILGAACLGAVGAFVALPSFESLHLFRTPASQVNDIESGDLIRLFSQTFALLLALVPKEAALSPLPGFDVTSSVPVAAIAAAIFWLAAIVPLREGARHVQLAPMMLVAGACALLSLGSNLPLAGSFVWNAISHAPLLQLMRTPDRFLALPALVVPLLGVLGLESFDEALLRRSFAVRRLVPIGVLALALGASLAFDAREHAIASEPTVAEREPAYEAATSAARAAGGRTMVLGFVRGGSTLGTSLYGMGMPFERYGWDVFSRYGDDAASLAGLFGRAGVASFITTPNWAPDSAALPDFEQTLGRNPALHPLLDRDGVNVFGLRDVSPVVTQRVAACYRGPIGDIGRVLSLRALAGYTLLDQTAPCDVGVLDGYDPLDDVLRVRHTISAASLTPAAPLLRDADYPYIVGRNLLAFPSYRNAVDGSSPFSAQPAVSIDGSWSATVPLRATFAQPSTLFLRIAAHRAVRGEVTAGARRIRFRLAPRFGMAWRTIALGSLGSARSLVVRLSPYGPDAVPAAPWHGVALDAVAVAPRLADAPEFNRPQIVIVPLDAGGRARDVWIPKGRYVANVVPASAAAPAPPFTLDGRGAARTVRFAAPARHAFAAGMRGGNALVVFVPFGLSQVATRPVVQRRSGAAWDIAVTRPGTLEAAVLDDGNWDLQGARIRGDRCDLINTCFTAVPAGKYRLAHRWPFAVVAGFSLTGWAILIALLCARFPRASRHAGGTQPS